MAARVRYPYHALVVRIDCSTFSDRSADLLVNHEDRHLDHPRGVGGEGDCVLAGLAPCERPRRPHVRKVSRAHVRRTRHVRDGPTADVQVPAVRRGHLRAAAWQRGMHQEQVPQEHDARCGKGRNGLRAVPVELHQGCHRPVLLREGLCASTARASSAPRTRTRTRTSRTTALPCPSGTLSFTTGATSCTTNTCAAGTYATASSANGVQCTRVPAMTYSEAGATQCAKRARSGTY